MKKKFISMVLLTMLTFSMMGCGKTTQTDVPEALENESLPTNTEITEQVETIMEDSNQEMSVDELTGAYLLSTIPEDKLPDAFEKFTEEYYRYDWNKLDKIEMYSATSDQPLISFDHTMDNYNYEQICEHLATLSGKADLYYYPDVSLNEEDTSTAEFSKDDLLNYLESTKQNTTGKSARLHYNLMTDMFGTPPSISVVASYQRETDTIDGKVELGVCGDTDNYFWVFTIGDMRIKGDVGTGQAYDTYIITFTN